MLILDHIFIVCAYYRSFNVKLYMQRCFLRITHYKCEKYNIRNIRKHYDC